MEETILCADCKGEMEIVDYDVNYVLVRPCYCRAVADVAEMTEKVQAISKKLREVLGNGISER